MISDSNRAPARCESIDIFFESVDRSHIHYLNHSFEHPLAIYERQAYHPLRAFTRLYDNPYKIFDGKLRKGYFPSETTNQSTYVIGNEKVYSN